MGLTCSNPYYPDANVTEHVLLTLGPPCLDPPIRHLTTVIYSLIFFVGLVGNLCTCLVIVKNSYMKTATNYYLCSLAISDLTSLVLGLPVELYQTWTGFYPFSIPGFVCKLRGFVSEWMIYCSILTIAGFSVERWLAICFPLKVQKFSRLSRVVKIITIIWSVAFIAALPFAFFAKVSRLTLDEKFTEISDLHEISDDNQTILRTDICAIDFYNPGMQFILFNCSFWVFFVAPMLLICILYIHIGLTIKNSNLRHTHQAQVQSRKMVIRTLLGVVVAFFVCWLPFHVQRLLTVYVTDWTLVLQRLFNAVYFISGYFYYANAAVNPILYNILNRKFRRAFLFTVCRCFLALKHGRERIPYMEATYMLKSTSWTPQAVAIPIRSPARPQQEFSPPLNHPMNKQHRKSFRAHSMIDVLEDGIPKTGENGIVVLDVGTDIKPSAKSYGPRPSVRMLRVPSMKNRRSNSTLT